MIQKLVNNFKYAWTVQNKEGRFRKYILSERDERKIVLLIRRNPRQSVSKLIVKVASVSGQSVSSDTIRRALRKAGSHGRKCRKRPYISHVNEQKRLIFSKQYINCPLAFWD